MYDHILKLLEVCGMGTLLLLALACSQPAPAEPTPTEPIPSETGLPGTARRSQGDGARNRRFPHRLGFGSRRRVLPSGHIH